MHLYDCTPKSEVNLRELTLQIRNSRAKLGSILEWLETNDPDPETIASLDECSEDICAEIDRLVVTIALLPKPGENPRLG